MSARVYFEYDRAEACGFRPFVEALLAAVPGHPWKAWPPENPWGDAGSWSQSIFGLTWDKVLGIVKAVDAEAEKKLRMEAASCLSPHGGDHTSEEGKATLRRNLAQEGNSSEYLSARLKRDHPEIAAEVERGEHKSIRAAARAAGIVKAPDPYKQLCKWWRAASEEQRAEFEDYIAASRRREVA